MEIQFITDAQGKRTAVIVPFDEWERTETAKEILEHVYLDGIIKERRDSKPKVNLDDLLTAEGLTRAGLERLIPEAQKDCNSLDGSVTNPTIQDPHAPV
jgi:hypothetical protein